MRSRRAEDRERSGRPPAYCEKEKVKRLFDKSDQGWHGINSSEWTCTEMCLYFLSKRITVSEETIRHLLRDMGLHYVKTVLDYSERRDSLPDSSCTWMHSRTMPLSF
jgi:transposase